MPLHRRHFADALEILKSSTFSCISGSRLGPGSCTRMFRRISSTMAALSCASWWRAIFSPSKLKASHIRDPDQCTPIHSIYSRINNWKNNILFPDHVKPSRANWALRRAASKRHEERCGLWCQGGLLAWRHDLIGHHATLSKLRYDRKRFIKVLPPAWCHTTELSILRNYHRHLPCHNKLPDDAAKFLRRALAYTCTGWHLPPSNVSVLKCLFTDHMTARESATSPWNAEDCKAFLDLLDVLENGKILVCMTGYLI